MPPYTRQATTVLEKNALPPLIINIMIEDDYVTRSQNLEKMILEKGKKLIEKYPGQIAEIKSAGALFGIFPKKSDSLLSDMIQK